MRSPVLALISIRNHTGHERASTIIPVYPQAATLGKGASGAEIDTDCWRKNHREARCLKRTSQDRRLVNNYVI